MMSATDTQSELYEVEIAGVPLRLKSSQQKNKVQALVSLVNQKINEAMPLTKTGSIQNASILASLHIAEELLNLKEQFRKELEQLENKTLALISELQKTKES